MARKNNSKSLITSYADFKKRMEERMNDADSLTKPTHFIDPTKSQRKHFTLEEKQAAMRVGIAKNGIMQERKTQASEIRAKLISLQKEIFTSITTNYDANKDVDSAIKNNSAKIEELLNLIEELKSVSLSSIVANYYNQLIIQLSRIDLRFVFYDKERAINRTRELPLSDGSIAKLTKSERAKLIDYLGGEDMAPRFKKYFPEYISDITEFVDVKHCLKLNASNYSKLNSKIKTQLKTNINLMVELIKDVPGVMKYLSTTEMQNVARINIQVLANAVYNYPEYILLLPTDFFKNCKPSRFFQTIGRTKFEKKANEYDLMDQICDRFLELDRYFSAPKHATIKYS